MITYMVKRKKIGLVWYFTRYSRNGTRARYRDRQMISSEKMCWGSSSCILQFAPLPKIPKISRLWSNPMWNDTISKYVQTRFSIEDLWPSSRKTNPSVRRIVLFEAIEHRDKLGVVVPGYELYPERGEKTCRRPSF